MDLFGQSPFDCRLQWGPEGVRQAAQEGHIIVVVDVLSFSTSVTVIVSQGGSALPVGSIPEAREAAAQWNAIELRGRNHPTAEGWSHSPVSLASLPPHRRFIYFSANGARCCAAAHGASALLVGSLVNASAAARVAARLQAQSGRPITVLACGERWEGDTLRPSLEDELGAGAILAALPGSKSPEAQAALMLFHAVGVRLGELVFDSASGRELRARGYEGDVTFAQRLDLYQKVPVAGPTGWLEAARLLEE